MQNFFLHFRARPKNSTALSLWVGVPLLIFNASVRFSGADDALLQWTQPLSHAICVAGSLMLVFLLNRSFDQVNVLVWSVLFVFHWLVGLSVAGTATTLGGIVVCTAVLVGAALVYWAAQAAGSDAWPYQLAPIEIAALIAPMLVLKAL